MNIGRDTPLSDRAIWMRFLRYRSNISYNFSTLASQRSEWLKVEQWHGWKVPSEGRPEILRNHFTSVFHQPSAIRFQFVSRVKVAWVKSFFSAIVLVSVSLQLIIDPLLLAGFHFHLAFDDFPNECVSLDSPDEKAYNYEQWRRRRQRPRRRLWLSHV